MLSPSFRTWYDGQDRNQVFRITFNGKLYSEQLEITFERLVEY